MGDGIDCLPDTDLDGIRDEVVSKNILINCATYECSIYISLIINVL